MPLLNKYFLLKSIIIMNDNLTQGHVKSDYTHRTLTSAITKEEMYSTTAGLFHDSQKSGTKV